MIFRSSLRKGRAEMSAVEMANHSPPITTLMLPPIAEHFLSSEVLSRACVLLLTFADTFQRLSWLVRWVE